MNKLVFTLFYTLIFLSITEAIVAAYIQKVTPPSTSDSPKFECDYPNENYAKFLFNSTNLSFYVTHSPYFGSMLKPATYSWKCEGVGPLEKYTVLMRNSYSKIEDDIFDNENFTRIYYPKNSNGKAIILLSGGNAYGDPDCGTLTDYWGFSMHKPEWHTDYATFLDNVVSQGYTLLMPVSHGCPLTNLGKYIDKVMDFTLSNISKDIILIGHSAGGSIGFFYLGINLQGTTRHVSNAILFNFPFEGLNPEIICGLINEKVDLVFSADDGVTNYTAIRICESQKNPKINITIINPGYGHDPFGENTEQVALPIFSYSQKIENNCNNGIDDDGDGLIDLNDKQDCCTGFHTSKFDWNCNIKCGASPQCDGKLIASFWCDGNTLKFCMCDYNEVNCRVDGEDSDGGKNYNKKGACIDYSGCTYVNPYRLGCDEKPPQIDTCNCIAKCNPNEPGCEMVSDYCKQLDEYECKLESECYWGLTEYYISDNKCVNENIDCKNIFGSNYVCYNDACVLDTGLTIPIINPSTPIQNMSYNIYCPTNGKYTCVDAKVIKGYNITNCYWANPPGWIENKSVFTCAGRAEGSYIAECSIIEGPPTYCKSSRTQKKYNISEYLCGSSCQNGENSVCCCKDTTKSAYYWLQHNCQQYSLVDPNICASWTKCYTHCMNNGYVSGTIRGDACCCNTCRDTDGGNNPFVKGNVSVIVNGKSYNYKDNCIGYFILAEQICNGTNWSTILYNCNDYASTNCSDGICMTTTTIRRGGRGGGGGGRMPLMMDIVNFLREFIDKIFI